MEQFIIDLKYVKDDIPIGHVEICSNKEKFNDNLVWISQLYVTDSYRHNGIGTKLMNRAIDTCKKLSVPKVLNSIKFFYRKKMKNDVFFHLIIYLLIENITK